MNQDDPRLGRGLESLIPKSSGTGSDSASPPASQPEPQSPPPQLDPHRELPTEPEPKELPAATASIQAPILKSEPKSQEPLIDRSRETAREENYFAHERHHQPKIQESVFLVETDKIEPNPDQPRRVFDQEALRDLSNSIREFGLMQPLIVTKAETEDEHGTQVKYILISGERRLMACKLLGMERVPAIIRKVNANRERLELAIIENIQREQLNPIETARAMARLQDEFRMTQREIAVRLGKSREVIANTVRLLDLPTNIQEAINEGRISESHGRMLLAITEPPVQQKIFEDLIRQGMTTRELKARVEAAKPRQAALPRLVPAELSPELKMLQEKLSSELGAPVKIQQEGNSGKITISFYSEEELRAIAEKLGGREESF